MKAIGAVDTTQAALNATITAGAVHGACLVTRANWLVLGLTGAAKRVAGIVSTPVAIGIVLGLGLSFMLDGAKLMAAGWWLSGAALLGTLALLTNRRVSVMFLLLAGGAAIALFRDPSLQVAVGQIAIEPRLPTFALRSITWSELAIGSLFLALPQVRDFSQLETCSRTYSRRTKKLWPHTLSLRLRTSKGP